MITAGDILYDLSVRSGIVGWVFDHHPNPQWVIPISDLRNGRETAFLTLARPAWLHEQSWYVLSWDWQVLMPKGSSVLVFARGEHRVRYESTFQHWLLQFKDENSITWKEETYHTAVAAIQAVNQYVDRPYR